MTGSSVTDYLNTNLPKWFVLNKSSLKIEEFHRCPFWEAIAEHAMVISETNTMPYPKPLWLTSMFEMAGCDADQSVIMLPILMNRILVAAIKAHQFERNEYENLGK